MVERCAVCARNPKRMNSEVAECSHCECPHRGKAWSDRPEPGYKAPEDFTHPLDEHFEKQD